MRDTSLKSLSFFPCETFSRLAARLRFSKAHQDRHTSCSAKHGVPLLLPILSQLAIAARLELQLQLAQHSDCGRASGISHPPRTTSCSTSCGWDRAGRFPSPLYGTNRKTMDPPPTRKTSGDKTDLRSRRGPRVAARP